MANVKFSAFPPASGGTPVTGVGLQSGLNVKFPLGSAATYDIGTTANKVVYQDSSGNVGIGMTPVNVLDITQTQPAGSVVKLLNANAGSSAFSEFRLTNSSSQTRIIHFGAGYTPSGLQRADSFLMSCEGVGGVTINSYMAAPIYFATNNTERARITADGFFKASDTGVYIGPSGYHEVNSSLADIVHRIANTNAATPYGEIIQFTNAAPNNTSSFFLNCTDNAAIRAKIYANGGIANYSANNVNLSDAALKTQITRYSDAELNALETSFKSVQWGKWKYRDQTHSDWNHGYTAQNIEEAFEKTAPELVDEDEIGPKDKKHKVVYDTDLTHIAMALLSRALKRIDTLEKQLATRR